MKGNNYVLCYWCHSRNTCGEFTCIWEVPDENDPKYKFENIECCSVYCNQRTKWALDNKIRTPMSFDENGKLVRVEYVCYVCNKKDTWEAYRKDNKDFCCGIHYDIYLSKNHEILIDRKKEAEKLLNKINKEFTEIERKIKTTIL